MQASGIKVGQAFRTGLLLCCLGVSACTDLSPTFGFQSAAQNTTRGLRALDVSQGAVRVRAPDGYCIDESASRAATGFVVMTGCAIVSDAKIMPTALGLITVQVGPEGSAVVAGSTEALVELLSGPDAGRVLSATEDPSLIAVQSAMARESVVLVAFTDQAPPPVAGLRDKEWRAFFDLRDRLVTVGLRAYAHTPLSETQGQSLLAAVVRSVNEANLETVPLVIH